jgi:glycosyltransferase involved in cell wall biosynthesis
VKIIFILASLSESLRNFRGPLIERLAARGHKVHVAAPQLHQDDETRQWLQARGIMCHDVPLARAGLNPISDLQLLWALARLLRKIRPDLFLGYTIKPVIWGLIAARFAEVSQRVALITGLGYAFTGQARGRRALVQKLARSLYAHALKRATLVFFQNPDDRNAFRQLELLPDGTPTELVNGSGVDTDAYAPVALPSGPLRFLLIARLLGDKGIREYVAAARIIRAEHKSVEFHLVGGVDPNPDAISLDQVQSWHDSGDIIWHGPVTDVRPAIAEAHIYVLPSYREGTPRTVLEAMSMGRAVITTDAPGCRETVQDGLNGFLVPVRQVEPLVQAMRQFIRSPELIETMGAKARQIVVDKYEVKKVNAVMIKAMAL